MIKLTRSTKDVLLTNLCIAIKKIGNFINEAAVEMPQNKITQNRLTRNYKSVILLNPSLSPKLYNCFKLNLIE